LIDVSADSERMLVACRDPTAWDNSAILVTQNWVAAEP
jgi:hypothetical protein